MSSLCVDERRRPPKGRIFSMGLIRFGGQVVVLARVRAALVGMMQQSDVRTSPLQRHLERFDRQMPIVDRTDRPAYDES
jgi:hypothetical protein